MAGAGPTVDQQLSGLAYQIADIDQRAGHAAWRNTIGNSVARKNSQVVAVSDG